MKIKLLSASVIATFMLGSVAVAQEYDDLYFSKKDRKEMQQLTARVVKPSTDFGVQSQPASKYANPDFNGGAAAGNTYTPAYNYYDESVAKDGPLYNDNYQPGMNNWNSYGMNSPFYDPFMSPYNSMNPYYGGMGMMNPYGYGGMMNPYYGMGSGMSMNMGYNSMFGPSMGLGYSRMLTSGLSMGLYAGMNQFGYGGFPGSAFGGYGYPVSYAYRPAEVSRVPAKTRMTSAPMQRRSIAQATATPDAQRKYPSRIRNFDARNATSTPASNGRYSRSSSSGGNNSWSNPTRRSTGNNSSWGNSGSSPSYRSTSSSPSYSRPASSGMSSPSRATRSIRRN